MLESIDPKILFQYSGIWKRFYNWINISENSGETNRSLICDSLLGMHNKGYASSSLNLMHSALNFFSSPSNYLANDIFSSWLINFIYKKRPWMLFEILAPCWSIISETINYQNLGFNCYNNLRQRANSTFNEYEENAHF